MSVLVVSTEGVTDERAQMLLEVTICCACPTVPAPPPLPLGAGRCCLQQAHTQLQELRMTCWRHCP